MPGNDTRSAVEKIESQFFPIDSELTYFDRPSQELVYRSVPLKD